MKIGIISGSGFLVEEGFEFVEEINLENKYGKPSSTYKKYIFGENEIFSLARHGDKHEFPPHLVNYQANIYGFYELGIDFIVAFGAVGGINSLLLPGDFLIPDNIVDLTYGRNSTYSEIGDTYHIDFTYPFCPAIREELLKILKKANTRFHEKGVYVCTNGPRLETAAEISYFSKLGFDVVGMTLMPEAALSRELGICYAAVNIVSNYAAGISKSILTTDEVVENVKRSDKTIKHIIKEVSSLTKKEKCHCKEAIKNARFK